jgi:hypothetical protein
MSSLQTQNVEPTCFNLNLPYAIAFNIECMHFAYMLASSHEGNIQLVPNHSLCDGAAACTIKSI